MSCIPRVRLCLALCLAFAGWTVHSQADPIADSSVCLECHDYGEDSPVHAVLDGSHGLSGDTEAMAGRSGCGDCHGASEAHTRAPTRNAPGISYGPRWTATSGDQDAACLACHEENVARHWRHALHMHNELTCVTCHDVHQREDKVLFERQQAEVCTVCHKAQKQGIHGMQRRAKRNPPCSTCHNPHDHETAQVQMLANRSEGCITCHDLARMAGSSRVSDKAKSYHKVMTNPDRTCIDCHEGVAHAAPDSVTTLHPQPVTGRTVTLFYPGVADTDWLLQEHPGSQPLRQGTNCQRCHRGEEAAMGAAVEGGPEKHARQVDIAFTLAGDRLRITLGWEGPPDDASLAMMWGDGRNEAFRRGGCFAACHSDLPGMSRDRGATSDKYLRVSRAQQARLGQPAILLPGDELDALLAEGQFAEFWQIELDKERAQRSILLAGTATQPDSLMWINKSHSDGTWKVVLERQLANTEGGISFISGVRYTFGVALNGASNPGSGHWVSLPMTFGLGADDTDFTTEKQ